VKAQSIAAWLGDDLRALALADRDDDHGNNIVVDVTNQHAGRVHPSMTAFLLRGDDEVR
jgi:hypothetical protein